MVALDVLEAPEDLNLCVLRSRGLVRRPMEERSVRKPERIMLGDNTSHSRYE